MIKLGNSGIKFPCDKPNGRRLLTLLFRQFNFKVFSASIYHCLVRTYKSTVMIEPLLLMETHPIDIPEQLV